MRCEVREPGEACRHEDKHQAPTRPLVPTEHRHVYYPIRLAKFIRTQARLLPHSVVKIYQDDYRFRLLNSAGTEHPREGEA